MKIIVFLALCLMTATSVTAYAASEKQISKSFMVANWKGEVPPTDEVAEPVNEPEDEHSGDDAKRTAPPAEPEDELEDVAPPGDGTVEPEGSATVDDANPEGELLTAPEDDAPPVEGAVELEDDPTAPRDEQHTKPEDAPPPSEDAIEPEDEQSMVETEENELPAKEVTNEPAPVVDDTPKDDSENEVG